LESAPARRPGTMAFSKGGSITNHILGYPPMGFSRVQ
jgi:hypothetical protein